MSQDFTDNVFDPAHVVQTDMSNVEKNDAALKSSFSGVSQPSNTVAGMLWFDTTNTLLKLRNNANAAWLGIMNGDTGTKIWIYSNSAVDGWIIDSTITDKIIAIKGGSNAYNVAGGNQAGTWTQPDHQLVEAEIPGHTHAIGDESITQTLDLSNNSGSGIVKIAKLLGSVTDTTSTKSSTHNHSCASTGGDSTHNHGTTYRPAAAVGTLQYMDI